MSFTYKGLSATLDRHIVTSEEIDRYMQRLVEQNPRIAEINDRPTELGDEVVLDYAGFCDGEQFASGTAEMQTLTLGSGMFIPGFEEQLVDKVPGEEVLVKVTFPEQYHSEALAGKAAEFKCKIHQIRVKTQYELDDTFAREVGGCDTLEEMRKRLGESMQGYSDERGEMDLQDRLLRQAAETLEFTPSEKQIEDETENQMQNLSAQLAQQGLNLEMYCQFLSTTEEELKAECRANAVNAVKLEATIEEIVSIENLEATEAEIDEAVDVVARQNHMTVEELKPYFNAEFQQAIVRSILTGKVMSLIRENATVTVTES
ncbi:MAG: trigger factor [Ruminococcaceae bacterium]|nr:trigger factor [Oscillospiraceae bacterium]